MIKLTPQDTNLGTIVKGSSRTYVVTVTNTSSKKINSIRTKVGCGSCTTASLPKNVLEAGESLSLTVTFTPTSTSPSTTKYVTLFYKAGDLVEKSIQLSFSAKVV